MYNNASVWTGVLIHGYMLCENSVRVIRTQNHCKWYKLSLSVYMCVCVCHVCVNVRVGVWQVTMHEVLSAFSRTEN